MEFGVRKQRIKVLFNCIGPEGRVVASAIAKSQIFPAMLLNLGWRRMPLLYLPFPLLGLPSAFSFLLLSLYFISVGWCVSHLTRTVVQYMIQMKCRRKWTSVFRNWASADEWYHIMII